YVHGSAKDRKRDRFSPKCAWHPNGLGAPMDSRHSASGPYQSEVLRRQRLQSPLLQVEAKACQKSSGDLDNAQRSLRANRCSRGFLSCTSNHRSTASSLDRRSDAQRPREALGQLWATIRHTDRRVRRSPFQHHLQQEIWKPPACVQVDWLDSRT